MHIIRNQQHPEIESIIHNNVYYPSRLRNPYPASLGVFQGECLDSVTPVRRAEPFGLWEEAISSMRQVVEIWDLIETDEREELGKHFQWENASTAKGLTLSDTPVSPYISRKVKNSAAYFPLLVTMISQSAVLGDEVAPGRLVDIGGYRLHIYCLGRGRPTVILDTDLGGSSEDWRQVQRQAKTISRVCIYDRAGYGWSDSSPLPRTSRGIAAELRTLLARARLSPPYVLAGHSFGGYNMRMFATLFPSDTAALILVDAPHEGQVNSLLQNYLLRQIDPMGILKDIWRQAEIFPTPSAADLEPIANTLGLEAKTLHAIVGEMMAFNESGKDLHAVPIQRDLPVVIIMHGKRALPEGQLGDEMEKEWLRLQRELVAGYDNSAFIIAKESAHHIPLTQLELIVDAVRGVVEAHRRKD